MPGGATAARSGAIPAPTVTTLALVAAALLLPAATSPAGTILAPPLDLPDGSDDVCVVVADLVGADLRVAAGGEAANGRDRPYARFRLAVHEILHGGFDGDLPVLSPCVAFCNGGGEPVVRVVMGQAWLQPGDRAVLALRRIARGGDTFWLVRDTRLVAGSLAADPPLQVIARGRFQGIGRDLCAGHGQAVLNDRVERVIHDAPETLDDLRHLLAASATNDGNDRND
jgi:hypothetical protein